MRTVRRLLTACALVPLGLAMTGQAAAAGPAGTRGFAAISGSGSFYTSAAFNAWTFAVRPRGMVVNYNPDGSAAGEADYAANQDDFADSDVAFRTSRDKLAGLPPQHVPVGFSYVPGPAGATALPYHLSVHGHLITNLKLSGRTVMQIFTGQITNWDDPRITRDYGHRLPSLPIIPVIQSDLAGTTFVLTDWMATLFTAQWNAFCGRVHPGLKPPCGPTEIYPPFGNAEAEKGPQDVMTFITSRFGQGAIGYVENPYTLNSHYPVLALGNAGGGYALPTVAHVTTALTHVIIVENPHSKGFLQQDLRNVFRSKDPHTYPLSSYSYLIVPRIGTRLPANFTRAKGRTLSAFLSYALCRGQRSLAGLGYAPLTPNLAKGGLQQAANIPGHVAVPSRCK